MLYSAALWSQSALSNMPEIRRMHSAAGNGCPALFSASEIDDRAATVVPDAHFALAVSPWHVPAAGFIRNEIARPTIKHGENAADGERERNGKQRQGSSNTVMPASVEKQERMFCMVDTFLPGNVVLSLPSARGAWLFVVLPIVALPDDESAAKLACMSRSAPPHSIRLRRSVLSVPADQSPALLRRSPALIAMRSSSISRIPWRRRSKAEARENLRIFFTDPPPADKEEAGKERIIRINSLSSGFGDE